MWNKETIAKLVELRSQGRSWLEISQDFPTQSPNSLRKTYYRHTRKHPLKVLILDIETAPIEAYVWGLFDQNVALNQIKKDWSVLSWSAKWLGDNKVMYQDNRGQKNVRDDRKILKTIWKLLDKADVVIGQNSKRFDIKKLNARFILSGMRPPSSFRQIDTMVLAKKHFSFTSNKLEYMTKSLCSNKKLDHKKFHGFELWTECLKDNLEAWEEMRLYNEMDVISTEELYTKLAPWGTGLDFSSFTGACSCGSISFKKHGFIYKDAAKYQRYVCEDCGAESRDIKNLAKKRK